MMNHNKPVSRIQGFEELVAQDALERQSEKEEKRLAAYRKQRYKSDLQKGAAAMMREGGEDAPTEVEAVAAVVQKREDGRTQRSVQKSKAVTHSMTVQSQTMLGGLTVQGQTMLGGLTAMGSTNVASMELASTHHLTNEAMIAQRQEAEDELLHSVMTPSKGSTISPSKNSSVKTTDFADLEKLSASPAKKKPSIKKMLASIKPNKTAESTTTSDGHSARILAVGRVRAFPIKGESQPLLKVVQYHSFVDGDFPLLKTTVQVQNVIVGLTELGKVQAILRMNDKPFDFQFTLQNSLHLTRQHKNKFTTRLVEKELFVGQNDDRPVHLDALRNMLLVVTEAGLVYVLKHKGDGVFTKPHLVAKGVFEHAKLAIGEEDQNVVVVLVSESKAHVYKVAFNMFNVPNFDVADNVALTNLVVEAASSKKKGEDVVLQFSENGEAFFLDADGWLYRFDATGGSAGSHTTVQKEDKVAFGKIAMGSSMESKSTCAIPFVLGNAPADKDGTENIWTLFPGVDGADEKVFVPGKVVSLGAASQFLHYYFELDPEHEDDGTMLNVDGTPFVADDETPSAADDGTPSAANQEPT